MCRVEAIDFFQILFVCAPHTYVYLIAPIEMFKKIPKFYANKQLFSTKAVNKLISHVLSTIP